MAPSATDTETPMATKTSKFLKSTGSLDGFKYDDLTPVIGTEFPELNIVDDLLNSPDADRLIRDLAIKISERGVVFFRAQDNLTNELQKRLIQRLGQLTTRPETHGLHIHPVLNDSREFGGADAEVSAISSAQRSTLYKGTAYDQSAAVWHSDISFEVAPADYSSLRLTQLPKTGGDTLWASGCEMFDRISKPYQKFLESLYATHAGVSFHAMAASKKFEFYTKERGSPLNFGTTLSATHPVIRTNPVTGWKSVFLLGTFPADIHGLTRNESEKLFNWFHELLTYGHDLQCRFHWKNPNDLAIWDNRSNFHTATNDYQGLGDRYGNRVVGVGEKPFFDPESKSRREDLGTMDLMSPAHR
ncbi:putative alpha-ketoglutarate-dependent sulfonate dioxygenase-2 [Coleophoma crateriformis]|uniref:Putative alpha-ketoglutarate-dependent sulfonate dioxygenase-2 n=1 Tax=Coleophoma crateriformis TaxID=565419 RepID=A0A3D8QIL8_9HELO|nr:putative alpha-ketoglutarate-dependent sulfonate dioxygenase-2 [Coleophoma crateriformis]